MKYIHKQLKTGGWNKLTLIEQLANVGSEVERTITWRNKNKEYSKMAFFRALELLELTIDDPKNLTRLQELTRVYEALGDYFMGENEYKSSDELWKKYFYGFSYLARIKGLMNEKC